MQERTMDALHRNYVIYKEHCLVFTNKEFEVDWHSKMSFTLQI